MFTEEVHPEDEVDAEEVEPSLLLSAGPSYSKLVPVSLTVQIPHVGCRPNSLK